MKQFIGSRWIVTQAARARRAQAKLWIALVPLAAVALLPLTAAAQTQLLQIPAVPAVPRVGGGTPLALVDAVRRALEQNLGVQQAALAVAIARSQVTQAEAGLYPTVGVGASNTQQTAPGNSLLGGTINIPSAGITGAPFTAVVPGSAPPQWNVHGTIA